LLHPRIVCVAAAVVVSVVLGGIAVGSSGGEVPEAPLNPTPIVAPRVETRQPETARSVAATRVEPRSVNAPSVPCTPPPSEPPHADDVMVFTTYHCP
jgi:hypothetical protein